MRMQNTNSISLSLDQEDIPPGSINGGLIQYSALPDGADMWLFIEMENSSRVPNLTGLAEFTNYSIKMAFLDADNKLCVFSEPVFERTGMYIHTYRVCS